MRRGLGRVNFFGAAIFKILRTWLARGAVVAAMLGGLTLLSDLVGGGGARAQGLPAGCVPALIAQSSSLAAAYASRAPRGYCDGRVANPNSGEIRLVSLVRGVVAFSPTDETLTIFTAAGTGDARVHGEDKRSGKSYRLDGVIPPGGLSIALASGVRALDVTSPNLGLTAWRPDPGGDFYVPVRTVGGGAVKAVFRTDVALVRAARQFCLNDQCQPQQIVANGLPDGGLIEVDIPLVADARVVTVKIVGAYPGGGYGSLVVKIAAPAQ